MKLVHFHIDDSPACRERAATSEPHSFDPAEVNCPQCRALLRFVTPEETTKISTALDAVIAPAQARLDAADPMWKALKPTASDWMTREESAECHRLKLLLPSHGQQRLEAKARLMRKRNDQKLLHSDCS